MRVTAGARSTSECAMSTKARLHDERASGRLSHHKLPEEGPMERLYTCCAGLDVHKQTVVACLLRPTDGGEDKEVRPFGTTTAALIALREWLLAAGCTHVAMEATGTFWKPIHNILEGCCTLLV